MNLCFLCFLFPQCRINRKDNSLQPNGEGLEIAILLGRVSLHLRRLKAISCSSTTPGSIRTKSDLKVNSAKRNKYVWKPALQSQPLLTHFTHACECCDFTFWHIKYLVKMETEALRRGKTVAGLINWLLRWQTSIIQRSITLLAAWLKPTGQISVLVLVVDLNWLHLQNRSCAFTSQCIRHSAKAGFHVFRQPKEKCSRVCSV